VSVELRVAFESALGRPGVGCARRKWRAFATWQVEQAPGCFRASRDATRLSQGILILPRYAHFALRKICAEAARSILRLWLLVRVIVGMCESLAKGVVGCRVFVALGSVFGTLAIGSAGRGRGVSATW
jgi:hypothetical protein